MADQDSWFISGICELLMKGITPTVFMRTSLDIKSIKSVIRDFWSGLYRRWYVLAHDGIMVAAAWFIAYWFRSNLHPIPEIFLHQAVALLPLVIGVHVITLMSFGVHRGLWRFISLADLVRLLQSVLVGTTLVSLILLFGYRLQYIPRSILVLHGIFLGLLLGLPRVLYRLIKDHHIASREQKKVLIVGAGQAGEMLVRDMLRASPRQYEPMAFIDDDPHKLGKEIHCIRVMGGASMIAELTTRWEIDLVMIAMPSATSSEMQRIVGICNRCDVVFRTLPLLQEIVSGQATTSDVRDVRIEDLLGREQVQLDWSSICAGLAKKRVLVTGGGGSIGSELCRQLARLEPAELVIVDHSEYNLYRIEYELRNSGSAIHCHVHLADINDSIVMQDLFRKYRPQVVFHAAAYKHVPLLEHQVRQAVRNNILGTRVVADLATAEGAETFILISTDKAVQPSSVMGKTKRAAELYLQLLTQQQNEAHQKNSPQFSTTRFITVRFGNVLGSAGSVVPLFARQIKQGGPVTVTHPDVERYFMTIREACQLILQVSTMGDGGEVFVLEMGSPVNVHFLARQMIRLSGKVPDKDIPIVFTGLREGEKMTETLFQDNEFLDKTENEKIYRARSQPLNNPSRLHQLELVIKAGDDESQHLTELLDQLVFEMDPAQLDLNPDDRMTKHG